MNGSITITLLRDTVLPRTRTTKIVRKKPSTKGKRNGGEVKIRIHMLRMR